MVHCTAARRPKCWHFVENKKIVKDNMFSIPPLFKTIQRTIRNRLAGNVQGI